MPFYEYRCNKGHTFEVMQSMSDDPLTTCTQCRSRVQRVFRPVAVHFKGSGFYTTDYGRKRGSDSAEPASKQSGDSTGKQSGDSTATASGDSSKKASDKKEKASSSD